MIRQSLDSYLALRRAAGFQLKKVEKVLRSFAEFCSKSGKTHICTQTAIEWAAQGSSLPQRAFRIKTVVHFARHLRAEDTWHELPPDDFFGGYQIRRRRPFIFSTADINDLLQRALQLGPLGSLRPYVYSTLFALLSITGMRISEALSLRFEDISTDGLIIHKTKFGKSRLLPLHQTSIVALNKYLLRRRCVAGADNHVFVSGRGTKLPYDSARYAFQTLVRALKLDARPGQPHPRLHDLRHSFATRALQSCADGRDAIACHMVALATYLGHSSIENTYWYLEATPALLADIASACERYVKGGLS